MESVSIYGLFISAFISSTIAPGGSEALLAYMLIEDSTQVVQLIVIATLGNTLGAFTTWALGLFTAKKYPLSKNLSIKQQRGINFVKKWGYWALLFSWLPIVGDGFCFAGGWLKMPFLLSAGIILCGKACRYGFIAYWIV